MKGIISPNTILLSTILAMAAALPAFASTLAVLEITIPDVPEGVESEEAQLTVSETKFLTDELRRQAIELVPNFSVMSRENIIALIPPTQEDFSSVVDIGLIIKSDYITHGSINKISNLLVLSVKLYEVQSGNVVGDFVGDAQDLQGLLDVIRKNSPKLFAKIAPPEPAEQNRKIKKSTWAAIGLDVLGAAAIGFGTYQHYQKNSYYKTYKNMPDNLTKKEYDSALKKAKDARKMGNAANAAGAALLATGIGIHIFF